MSVICCIHYDIHDPETYARYNPGSMATIMPVVARHGGELIGAGPSAALAGEAHHVGVVLRFPDEGAIGAWLEDPDYADAKAIRESATHNTTVWVVPAAAAP